MEDVLKGAIATWGTELQKIVAIEECSEVIKEICKYERGQYSKLHMAEEIADLKIVLGQLVIMYGENELSVRVDTESTKEVIKEISYMQYLIIKSTEELKLSSERGVKRSDEAIKIQIDRVDLSIQWLKKQLNIENLVDVYFRRKVDRLRERIIKANQS